jgi:hypothetical protein
MCFSGFCFSSSVLFVYIFGSATIKYRFKYRLNKDFNFQFCIVNNNTLQKKKQYKKNQQKKSLKITEKTKNKFKKALLLVDYIVFTVYIFSRNGQFLLHKTPVART